MTHNTPPTGRQEDAEAVSSEDLTLNYFRVLTIVQGGSDEELQDLARFVKSLGHVGLDATKLTGPSVLLSQGERAAFEFESDRWAVVLLYCGQGTEEAIDREDYCIEGEGTFHCDDQGRIRFSGTGCPELQRSVFAFVVDPAYGELELQTTDATVRFRRSDNE